MPRPATDDEIRWLYETVLGRTPREDEVAERRGETVEGLVTSLRGSAEAAGEVPTAGDLTALYRWLLGRPARPDELEPVLDARLSTTRVLRMLLASEEHAAHAARADRPPPKPRVNLWTAEHAHWTHRVGTVSDDGVAEVGQDGYLFLRGGSNAMREQALGRVELPDGWLEGWQALLAAREADARRLGVRLGTLVVPDKVCVLPDRLPSLGAPEGPRPIERLLEAGLPLRYPLAGLQGLRPGAEPYLRTDSHLTYEGNVVLLADALEGLGEPPATIELEQHSYLAPGDLGAHLEPQVLEVMPSFPSPPGTIVEDNRKAVHARGGHIGSHRVWRNPTAERPDAVVVFGDSYGFGDPIYPGLAFLLAQVYAEVHFAWIPFGWDPAYVERVGARLVVSQTAERFVVRVPAERVDWPQIVAAALERAVDL